MFLRSLFAPGGGRVPVWLVLGGSGPDLSCCGGSVWRRPTISGKGSSSVWSPQTGFSYREKFCAGSAGGGFLELEGCRIAISISGVPLGGSGVLVIALYLCQSSWLANGHPGRHVRGGGEPRGTGAH